MRETEKRTGDNYICISAGIEIIAYWSICDDEKPHSNCDRQWIEIKGIFATYIPVVHYQYFIDTVCSTVKIEILDLQNAAELVKAYYSQYMGNIY